MENEWVNLEEDLHTGRGAGGAARHQLRDRELGNGESQREREGGAHLTKCPSGAG